MVLTGVGGDVVGCSDVVGGRDGVGGSDAVGGRDVVGGAGGCGSPKITTSSWIFTVITTSLHCLHQNM